MQRFNQSGAMNILLIPLIVAVVLLVAAAIFGGWAYSGRQDYKNNVDQKISTAVAIEKQQESTVKDQAFAIAEKLPLKAYDGPETYGSLVVNYPRTWSAYVDDTGQGDSLVDGYFNPGTVPSISSPGSVFALRVQVIDQSYSQVLSSFTSKEQDSLVTVAPYKLPKVPNVVGVEVVGQVYNSTVGTMVILPLRSTTLEIWTQGTQYLTDYNTNILPNFSFSP